MIHQTLRVAGLILASFVSVLAAQGADKPVPAKDLFNGKTLEGWKVTDFGGEGKVAVRDGTIIMERGNQMTGITWSGKPPRSNYELTLEGKRIEGSDFFCTTTFPVGDKYCSFVTGGWGGSMIGLSTIDHMDASENQTSASREFKNNTWYQFRIRVTEEKIEVWIDKDQVVDQDRKDHTFGVRIECDASRPLGISTYESVGAVRNIRLKELK
ncbi:MAG: DUF1080 domain-containing protein [Planctomycetota bacterium]